MTSLKSLFRACSIEAAGGLLFNDSIIHRIIIEATVQCFLSISAQILKKVLLQIISMATFQLFPFKKRRFVDGLEKLVTKILLNEQFYAILKSLDCNDYPLGIFWKWLIISLYFTLLGVIRPTPGFQSLFRTLSLPLPEVKNSYRHISQTQQVPNSQAP